MHQIFAMSTKPKLALSDVLACVLMLVGGMWVYYSDVQSQVAHASALSDAMYLETYLDEWLAGQVSEGNVSVEDAREIFDAYGKLLIGGEDGGHFEAMIRQDVERAVPPSWAGLAIALAGLLGFIAPRFMRKP